MKKLTSTSAYLKGLKDGIADDMSAENINKLIDNLIALTGELAERVEELEERVRFLELIKDDDDEDPIYDDDDDDDFMSYLDEDYDDDDEDEDSDLFDIQCTECGEDFTVEYDEIMSDDAIRCPHCGARIELSIDFDDGDDE